MYSVQSQNSSNSSGLGNRSFLGSSKASLLSSEKLNSMVRSTEKLLDQASVPSKSYVPIIGRFLLVSGFIEDALRILFQWSSQVDYIYQFRGLPKVLAVLFLGYFCLGMLSSALCVIFRFKTIVAGGILVSIIVLQSFVYGLLTEFEFIMRSISIIGGLLILMAEEHSTQDRASRQSQGAFAGLPASLTDYSKDRATWLSFVGRIFIIALVITTIFTGEMNFFRLTFGLISLVVSVMIIIGFKAKIGAACLLLGLAVFNVIINNWWSVSGTSHMRDFLKFDFFQTLSVIGGLVLLVVTGPGFFSIDEKQKEY